MFYIDRNRFGLGTAQAVVKLEEVKRYSWQASLMPGAAKWGTMPSPDSGDSLGSFSNGGGRPLASLGVQIP